MTKIERYIELREDMKAICQVGLENTQLHLDLETEAFLIWNEMTPEEKETVA